MTGTVIYDRNAFVTDHRTEVDVGAGEGVLGVAAHGGKHGDVGAGTTGGGRPVRAPASARLESPVRHGVAQVEMYGADDERSATARRVLPQAVTRYRCRWEKHFRTQACRPLPGQQLAATTLLPSGSRNRRGSGWAYASA
ncbi:hypothetical protein ACFC09_17670 [Streptomyces sp. NPDC056161]|uniref:hypothetical protein n=1 Tax=Streptomyces sp. NPDC056161 TaxID=3345732 RepID=UPI0035E297F1